MLFLSSTTLANAANHKLTLLNRGLPPKTNVRSFRLKRAAVRFFVNGFLRLVEQGDFVKPGVVLYLIVSKLGRREERI